MEVVMNNQICAFLPPGLLSALQKLTWGVQTVLPHAPDPVCMGPPVNKVCTSTCNYEAAMLTPKQHLETAPEKKADPRTAEPRHLISSVNTVEYLLPPSPV